jgi:hypothetical protein
MSQPQRYLQPYAPAHPTFNAQPNGVGPHVYPQRRQAQPPWNGRPTPPSYRPWAPPAAPQPLFRVRLTKHTGLVMLYINQSYTVTGTLEQCEAAIREAQLHNVLAGWWSFSSALVMNWAALIDNLSARKALRRQAIQHYPGQCGVVR